MTHRGLNRVYLELGSNVRISSENQAALQSD
jgi:hypothetical protein